MRHELQTVVQIFELGVLVGEELGGGEVGGMVALLLLLLLMMFLLEEVLLCLVEILLWAVMSHVFVVVKHPARFFPRDALSGRDDEFVELEAVRDFGAGGGDAETVSPGRHLDLVAGETASLVDEDLEVGGFLLDLDAGWSAKISVGKTAVSECEGVYCMVGLVVGVAIVHETSDTAARTTVHINYQSQPIEFADGVYTVRRYMVLSFPRKPYLEISAAPFRT